MNPGNYHPNAGMMNAGGQGTMMDPYGQSLQAGYSNGPQMPGAFQTMQMPNQSTSYLNAANHRTNISAQPVPY